MDSNNDRESKKDGRRKERVSGKYAKVKQRMQEDPDYAENYRQHRRESAARAAIRKQEKSISMGLLKANVILIC